MGTCCRANWSMYFDKGEQAPVPLLAGFNSGEIRSLRILAPRPPATAADYEKVIRDRYVDMADEFLQLYPSTNMEESILATTRDALYGWTAVRLVKKQAAKGLPSFLYFFDHGYPCRRQPLVCTAFMPVSCRTSSELSMARRHTGPRSRTPTKRRTYRTR